MAAGNSSLKVLFIAGSLGKGGAEKQLMYMLRALQDIGAEVRVIALAEGEFHERTLRGMGIQPIQIDKRNPLSRLSQIVMTARTFRPHFIQATHFYAGFYAGAAGRILRIPSIGAIRGDLYHDLNGVGLIGRWLLHLPTVLLSNSNNARENALQIGISPRRVFVLQNVIDLKEFDRRLLSAKPGLLRGDLNRGCCYAVSVARLIPVKRLERFLKGLSLARQRLPSLKGVIIGSGPEEAALRNLAERLGLQPDHPLGGLQFLGERNDVPQLISQADMFVLTSDREGFPNVILEAMAASLPIISTPAGETPGLVKDGENGYLIPFDDPLVLANRMVHLAQSPILGAKLGSEGRVLVEHQYSVKHLTGNLLDTYRAIAHETRNNSVLALLEKLPSAEQEKISSY